MPIILNILISVTSLSDYDPSPLYCNDTTTQALSLSIVDCATRCTSLQHNCKGFAYELDDTQGCHLKNSTCFRVNVQELHVAYKKKEI
jgi:hypothetical protein